MMHLACGTIEGSSALVLGCKCDYLQLSSLLEPQSRCGHVARLFYMGDGSRRVAVAPQHTLIGWEIPSYCVFYCFHPGGNCSAQLVLLPALPSYKVGRNGCDHCTAT